MHPDSPRFGTDGWRRSRGSPALSLAGIAFALLVGVALAPHASAAGGAPVGRWVGAAEGHRRVLQLMADSTFLFFTQDGDKVGSETGTYATKDAHLTLEAKDGRHFEFDFVVAGERLSLTAPGTPGASNLSLDFGPLVGRWRSDKGGTFLFGRDGTLATGDGGKGTYEPVYSFPGEADGQVVLNLGDKSGVAHFVLEEKGSRLLLGGGLDGKDPADPLRVFVRVADEAAPPAPTPADATKRLKFPPPPKVPGTGGTAPPAPPSPPPPQPGTPTAPGTPGTPPQAPGAAAPTPAGLVWDTTNFEKKGFKVVKATYDPKTTLMTWVLEAVRDSTTFFKANAVYYDEDGAKVLWSVIVATPPGGYAKAGERIRAATGLPEVARNKAVKAVVVDPD